MGNILQRTFEKRGGIPATVNTALCDPHAKVIPVIEKIYMKVLWTLKANGRINLYLYK